MSELDQYEVTDGNTYLNRAEQIIPVGTRAWDDDGAKTGPGGMDWFDSPGNNIRATNVTSLSAQLAARLYEITHNSAYLTAAEKWYGWVYSCMRQAPGLYINDGADDGSTDPALWSYNSGSTIGAAVAIYRGTGNADYLNKAVEDAQASLVYWAQGGRPHDQPTIFNARPHGSSRSPRAVRHGPDLRRPGPRRPAGPPPSAGPPPALLTHRGKATRNQPSMQRTLTHHAQASADPAFLAGLRYRARHPARPRGRHRRYRRPGGAAFG
ncbi:glycoside hydrolase family 76 protein [Streptomyces antimycoticus]|uniref:glycoside hydrolase family 76 protein n=1 Tax=Streptomyces antimycoticus TaxID=68175 RepID=UPI003434FD89